jgi:GTP-binding protein HflX
MDVGVSNDKAVLVAVAWRRDDLLNASDSLDELARLADTAGATVVDKLKQELKRPHPATLIGSGKIEEVKLLVQQHGANLVIFDDELTPAQQRNLEKGLGVRIIDRTQLILDIFAQRAHSQDGKLQVELAQLEYLLPRLTRAWTHLSRLGGGVGTRGPGETQLEVDRRRVREKIALLRKRLTHVTRTRGLHRDSRAEVPYPMVALVGYTNSGKSTLMNRLTQAGVFVEDKLFATLDPTVRLLRLPGNGQALLVDTVGFIHKLPHGFVDAFKSTLEEVHTAHLLLHVVDGSDAHAPEQMIVVERVLRELDADQTPRLTVFNKSDRSSLPGLAAEGPSCRVSARTGEGVPQLLRLIGTLLAAQQERLDIRVPVARGDLLAELHRAGRVTDESLDGDAFRVTAFVPPKVAGRIRKALADAEAGAPRRRTAKARASIRS